MNVPLILRAVSREAVEQIARVLCGAILSEGGWVHFRWLSGDGNMHLSFEFQRRSCVEIYTALIASGLELSADSHWKITVLCQCTRQLGATIATDPVSVELTVQAPDCLVIRRAVTGRDSETA